MKDLIAVYSDNSREISWAASLGYYTSRLIKEPKITGEEVLLIVDCKKREEAVAFCNSIRALKTSLPILILTDFPGQGNVHILRSVEGRGPVRILEYRKRYNSELLLYSQSLIHPEYPDRKNDVAIVVPVFDEEERFNNIINQTAKLRAFIENGFINARIFFVNDGSRDLTGDLIEKLVQDEEESLAIIEKIPLFSSHNLIQNTRKAGTYIAGLENVDAEYIFFLDGDDSFVVDDIARMINILKEGYYDFVIGTKDMTAEERKPVRQFISFCKRSLTRPLLPRGVSDSQTGLKGMRAVVGKTLLQSMHVQNGLAADLEMLYLARLYNFRVLELPVTCFDREGSHINIIRDSAAFVKAIIKIPWMNRGLKKRGVLP